MKTKIVYIGLLLFPAFSSCKEDAIPEPTYYPYTILTEINNITSEGATFNATITDLGIQKILDYGFVWDESTTIPTINSIIKSFGENAPIGDYSYKASYDLEIGKEYCVRAYVITDKLVVYSNIQSFISKGCLPPIITKFYPDSGSAGRIISIIGSNFSSRSSNNKVYFGTNQANVIRSNSDTLLVQCPAIAQTTSVNIKLEVANQATESQSKFRLINPWLRLNNFPGGARYWSSSFTIDSKGYVTLGKLDINNFASTDLWEYDIETNQWKTLNAFPGLKRKLATSFTISGLGYMGLGSQENQTGSNELTDLWEYNPQNDTWNRKADFPGSTWGSVYPHFVVNNKLYLYTFSKSNELWVYDPLIDKWTELPKNEQIKNIWIREGFSVDDNGYFIEVTGVAWDKRGFSIWEFDPEQNKLNKIDSISTIYLWLEDCSFNIGNKLYISARYGKLLEYDLATRLMFCHNHPSEQNKFNFRLIINDKAILNIAESNKVTEFYSR